MSRSSTVERHDRRGAKCGANRSFDETGGSERRDGAGRTTDIEDCQLEAFPPAADVADP